MNSDIKVSSSWNLSFNALRPPISRRRFAFRLLQVALHQTGPSAIDVLAHRRARLGSHGFKFVVNEFDQGGVGPVGREADIDFGFHCEVRLPSRIDLPDHREASRWIPDDDRGGGGL